MFMGRAKELERVLGIFIFCFFKVGVDSYHDETMK